MRRYKNTDEEIVEAVKTSQSLREVMVKLKRNPKGGGGYQTIRRIIKNLNLDSNHLNGQGWRRGIRSGYKRPIEDYLSNRASITSFHLKNRLIREGVKKHRCEKCDNEEWLGQPIPLELHHINGKHDDNTLDNIQFLCPNCHGTTDNFAGKSKGKYGGVT